MRTLAGHTVFDTQDFEEAVDEEKPIIFPTGFYRCFDSFLREARCIAFKDVIEVLVGSHGCKIFGGGQAERRGEIEVRTNAGLKIASRAANHI